MGLVTTASSGRVKLINLKQTYNRINPLTVNKLGIQSQMDVDFFEYVIIGIPCTIFAAEIITM
jgi:hypothetical protein